MASMVINIALFFLVLFFLLPGMMIFSMLMRDHVDVRGKHDIEQLRDSR